MHPRRIDRILIVAVPIAIFLIWSIQPSRRLQETMPSDFVNVGASLRGERKAAEEETAQAYWSCAESVIQYKYAYGNTLPDQPPPEFQVDTQRFPRASLDAAAKLYYWKKLQKAWLLPSMWEQRYEWNFDWLGKTVSDVIGEVSRFFRDLFRFQ